MLDSVLDSYSTKKSQGIKETGMYKPLKGKKININYSWKRLIYGSYIRQRLLSNV